MRSFLAIDTPPGIDAELVEGEIVMTPLRSGNHAHVVSLIAAQVTRESVVEMMVSWRKGLAVPSRGKCPASHVIPSLTVVPKDTRIFRDAPPWMPCEGVEMVVETTSSHPDRERFTRRFCYALGRIPIYLLIDRERMRVSLFTNPKNGDYDELSRPFGEHIPLPAPFGFDLETKRFV